MKKFVFFLALALVTFTSCSNSKKQEVKEKTALEKEIEGVQEMLPIQMSIGEITHVTYDNNYVDVLAEVDETQCDMDQMEANMSFMKPQMLNMIKMSQNAETTLNDAMSLMMKWVGEEKAGMKFIYKGKKSGREVVLKMTPDEIQAALTDEDDALVSGEVLDAVIENMSSEIPMNCGDGMYITALEREERCVVMEYTFDEELYEIDVIAENVKELKPSFLNDMRAEESTIEGLCRLVKQEGLGLTIRWKGDKSPKHYDMIYTNDEL